MQYENMAVRSNYVGHGRFWDVNTFSYPGYVLVMHSVIYTPGRLVKATAVAFTSLPGVL